MQNNKCDICGKDGKVVPRFKQKTKVVETEASVPNPKYDPIKSPDEPQVLKQKVKYEKPVTKKMKTQDPFTGKIVEQEVGDLEYLEPRIIRVDLSLGFNERISREFCEDCFPNVKSKIKKLWDVLEGYDPI